MFLKIIFISRAHIFFNGRGLLQPGFVCPRLKLSQGFSPPPSALISEQAPLQSSRNRCRVICFAAYRKTLCGSRRWRDGKLTSWKTEKGCCSSNSSIENNNEMYKSNGLRVWYNIILLLVDWCTYAYKCVQCIIIIMIMNNIVISRRRFVPGPI